MRPTLSNWESIATSAVSSPPPCGEGLGVGVHNGGLAWGTPHPNPPPQGGRERTACLATRSPLRTPDAFACYERLKRSGAAARRKTHRCRCGAGSSASLPARPARRRQRPRPCPRARSAVCSGGTTANRDAARRSRGPARHSQD